MKKIGLVSYHREANYGTMLQAYALAEAIQKHGYKCEYIDYYESLKKPALVLIIRKCVSTIYHLFRLPPSGEYGFFDTYEFRGIINAFKEFHKKYIPVSPLKYYYNTLDEINNKYDYFIVGSDQTWSRSMNDTPYAINFLPFVKDVNKKRSYAPSIGTIHLEEDYKKFLIHHLKSFSYLSCRERPNCDFLSIAIGKEIHFVVDPTLLLCREDWNTISTPPNINIKYILAYILGTKQCVSEFAERLGKEKGLPVYYIITRPEYLNKENVLNNVGPSEFIGLIRNAEYIVTDSFHGTLFSINYGKNFYSFNKRNTNEGIDNDRILVFLNELNLNDRFRIDDDYRLSPDIDYYKHEKVLKELRESSTKYLLSLLRNEHQ